MQMLLIRNVSPDLAEAVRLEDLRGVLAPHTGPSKNPSTPYIHARHPCPQLKRSSRAWMSMAEALNFENREATFFQDLLPGIASMTYWKWLFLPIFMPDGMV